MPTNNIEPEVAEQMQIQELKMPTFTRSISEAELEAEGFNKRDKRILLQLSLVGQQNDWLIGQAIETNIQQRNMEAELIRQRIQRRKLNKVAGVVRWASITVGAGIIATFARKVADKWFP